MTESEALQYLKSWNEQYNEYVSIYDTAARKLRDSGLVQVSIYYRHAHIGVMQMHDGWWPLDSVWEKEICDEDSQVPHKSYGLRNGLDSPQAAVAHQAPEWDERLKKLRVRVGRLRRLIAEL